MPMPDKVRVGAIDYAVTQVAGLTDDPPADGSDPPALLGKVSFTHMTIKVDADMPPRMKAAVLWHETVHALLYQHGIDLGCDEERIVTALGYALTQLVRDNPALMMFTRDAP